MLAPATEMMNFALIVLPQRACRCQNGAVDGSSDQTGPNLTSMSVCC